MGKSNRKLSSASSGVKIMYHGSGTWFEVPDLGASRGFRDFGYGFYLTPDIHHAEGMALKRSNITGEAYIYKYNVPKIFNNSISVLAFRGPSVDWVDFILSNRSLGIQHKYDVVIGPTADAKLIELLNMYTDGEFGTVGTLKAKLRLIDLIKPRKFPMQTCICTSNALLCIKRVGYKRII